MPGAGAKSAPRPSARATFRWWRCPISGPRISTASPFSTSSPAIRTNSARCSRLRPCARTRWGATITHCFSVTLRSVSASSRRRGTTTWPMSVPKFTPSMRTRNALPASWRLLGAPLRDCWKPPRRDMRGACCSPPPPSSVLTTGRASPSPNMKWWTPRSPSPHRPPPTNPPPTGRTRIPPPSCSLRSPRTTTSTSATTTGMTTISPSRTISRRTRKTMT
mmetsp:Transcript_21366/g.42802  ORF Transcript_21366/g.42802 Transcript_21366/m.42802 type:complete len:220 (+) Transcript_21366:1613-2272(+)